MDYSKSIEMQDILASNEFQETEMVLPCAIGVSAANKPFLFDLTKAGHVIIAGTFGKGIGNAMHAILFSLLNKKSPDEMKLILIDARRLEFEGYKTLTSRYLVKTPHMKDSIIDDIQEAVDTLNSLNKLMEQRYQLLYKYSARNIEDYNCKCKDKANSLSPQDVWPYYIVVINELRDFMLTAKKDFEYPLISLAQLARVVGIYIVVATEHPNPDVINGSIKANFPCRIALRTKTGFESRIIIDQEGAELLPDDKELVRFSNRDIVPLRGISVKTEYIERL